MVNIGGTFGFDFLLGTPSSDMVRGFAGNDTVQGLGGNDRIFGDLENDLLAGNEGADTLSGGQGSDTIYGGQESDWMFGDRGNDLLIGGEGADILTGGAGDDLFAIDSVASTIAQADTITDFGNGNDKIVLTEGLKFSDLNISVSDNQTVMQDKNTGNYLGVVSGKQNLTQSNFISLFGGIDSGQLLPISVNTIMGDRGLAEPSRRIGLEVANTPEEQATGLMFRTELPEDRGMLFPIAPARNVRFWMRNVFIELDMVFLREGVVQAIIPNVPPCLSETCPNYGPDVPVDGVIELKGGRAAQLGLKVGDRIPNLP